IYLTFDSPEASKLGQIVSVLVLSVIMLSSFCFILSTIPECQVTFADGRKPVPHPTFDVIEKLCLFVFVSEYVIRLCSCW
ncbi:unnamed protein product, partial [Polarella glacialis]